VALGSYSKDYIETYAQERIRAIIGAFEDLESHRMRLDAELAAGTLNGPDYYPPGDQVAQADKTNLLGALDDFHTLYQGIQGTADLAQLNYLRYAAFLL